MIFLSSNLLFMCIVHIGILNNSEVSTASQCEGRGGGHDLDQTAFKCELQSSRSKGFWGSPGWRTLEDFEGHMICNVVWGFSLNFKVFIPLNSCEFDCLSQLHCKLCNQMCSLVLLGFWKRVSDNPLHFQNWGTCSPSPLPLPTNAYVRIIDSNSNSSSNGCQSYVGIYFSLFL